MPGKPWTKTDIEFLTTHYPSQEMTAREIAVFLGRTRTAVKGKALTMGLAAERNHWTEKEDAVLMSHYEDRDWTLDNLLSLLPDRTYPSLVRRAHILGLSRKRDWTEDEDNLVRQYYASPDQPIKLLVSLLPRRSRESITTRAQHLNVTRADWTNELKLQRSLFQSYKKKSAESRQLSFTLSFSLFVFLIGQCCHYCGSTPANSHTRHDWGNLEYNGIDRIDSDEGYIPENVVPCCSQCNRAKRDLSYDDFVSWIKAVYEHLYGDRK